MEENTKESARKCPRCGAPLAADAPEGLCPRCLMSLNLATQTDAPEGPHGTKVVKPLPTLEEIAKRFPQLEILEVLGRGGMGVVYKARQPRLDRIVALKLLAPEKENDPQFAERFSREAKALARLNHPNIVTVYDFGEANGFFYLIMEFVDGASLRQLLESRRIVPEEALAIVPKICEALQFAHDQGVVHRDIKPENVLLDKAGRVKIADFGIAKIVGQAGRAPVAPGGEPAGASASPQTPSGQAPPQPGSAPPPITETKQVVGTPHYMAPEQVEKPATVDHRADIYSLGVVFYEMLTGELPLGKFAPPSQKVEVDVRLDEVVLRSLEKEPERRYQQASEVKTRVETIAASNRPEEKTLRPEGQTIASPAARPKYEGPARLSRMALIGAIWAPWFFLAIFPMYSARMASTVNGGNTGPAGWQILLMVTLLPLGLTAPFGATILGWTAISKIRRSSGRLYGLGLAVFDALLYPLLALDVLLGVFWYHFPGGMSVWDPSHSSRVMFLTILSSLVLDALIVIWVWRQACRPFETTPPQSANPVSAIIAIAFAALSGLLGLAAFSLFPNPPVALVWGTLAAALLGVALAAPERNSRLGKQALVVGSANIAIWLLVFLISVTLRPQVQNQAAVLAEEVSGGQPSSAFPQTQAEPAALNAGEPKVEPDYDQADSAFSSAFTVAEALQKTVQKRKDARLAESLATQLLTQLRSYNNLVGDPTLKISDYDLQKVTGAVEALQAGKWDQAVALLDSQSEPESAPLGNRLQDLAERQSGTKMTPTSVVLDRFGNAFVADFSHHAIRKISPQGKISTLAGNPLIAGANGLPEGGYADGTGKNARFNSPFGLAIDAADNLYVGDFVNEVIRKITPQGVVTTIAGKAGVAGFANGSGKEARFNSPHGVASDSAGNLYVADQDNHVIRKLTPAGPTWSVTTLAGQPRVSGNADGPDITATFTGPSGLTVDGEGNIFVADTYANTIRKITPQGMVSTLAGAHVKKGDKDARADGEGRAARFYQPFGITADQSNLFVADSSNGTIRKITATGIVSTIAGSSHHGGFEDGPGASARFASPYGITADHSGNLYVADYLNHAVRKLTPSATNWIVSTFGRPADQAISR